MTPVVRFLTPADAEAYWHLRVEALGREPLAFGRSVEEHRATAVADTERRLARSDSWTAGAFAGGRLRGTATLSREHGRKERHKASLAGVYVGPELRGRGVGRQLVTALVKQARTLAGVERLTLAVGVDNAAAQALYHGLGFVPWGIERAALKLGSEYVDEDHLVLVL